MWFRNEADGVLLNMNTKYFVFLDDYCVFIVHLQITYCLKLVLEKS